MASTHPDAPVCPECGRSDELIAQSIVLDVAELGDRTSPEEQPEMMLVTAEELTAIVLSNLNPT